MSWKRKLVKIFKNILESMIFLIYRPLVSKFKLDKSKHSIVIPEVTYSPWKIDEDFQGAYKDVKKNTLVDIYRCYELWQLVEQVDDISGDIIEIGVWRGGSGCLLAKRAQHLGLNCSVYLCDTFEGVVKAGEKDPYFRGGELADTSVSMVRSLASGMDLGNVEILTGIFPEETGYLVEDKTFRFCHLDVTTYLSTKDVVYWIWDKLSPGGVIVFDDYGVAETEGVATFVDEEALKPDRLIVRNLNGHAIMIKLR